MKFKTYIGNFLKSNFLVPVLSGEKRHTETVVVDYSSPNIAKPFHLGHFRATVTGNFVKNINEAFGNKVIGINYIGDWGSQFDILNAGFSKYGNEIDFQTNPLEHLYKVYVQANRDKDLLTHKVDLIDQNSLIEQSFWQRIRRVTSEQLDRTYSRMNINFSSFEYESDYVNPAHEIVDQMLQQGLAHINEDGLVVISRDKLADLNEDAILLKSNNSTLYLTRDLAAAISRYKRYNFDRIHYVVEIGQRLHFEKLQSILIRLGYNWANLLPNSQNRSSVRDQLHIPFGRILGVSTRLGQGLFLSNILDNAQSAMLLRMHSSPNTRYEKNSPSNSHRIADQLGVTCLITCILYKSRQKPMNLQTYLGLPVTHKTEKESKKDHALEFTGLSLQYCHARLCSLEYRVLQQQITSSIWSDNDTLTYNSLDLVEKLERLKEWPENTINNDVFIMLSNHWYQFPTMMKSAYDTYEPCLVLHYAIKLVNLINRAWNHLPVLHCADKEEQLVRFAVFMASRNLLATCLHLLGIKPLRSI